MPYMGGNAHADLAQILANLAVEMQDHTDSESTLRSIVDGAVAIVPGARWAGISLIEGRRVMPRVPSEPLVAVLEGCNHLSTRDRAWTPCATIRPSASRI